MAEERNWKGNPEFESFLVPIDDVQINPENVRKHGQKDIDALAASLKDHGQQHLVLVQPEDFMLMAGEGRWLAMKQLGWTHIAALGSDIADSGERKLFSIRDNRTAELSDWDLEALSSQLKALQEDYDLQGTGLWQKYELDNQPMIIAKHMDLKDLKRHPRNYRKHPEDQIEHLMQSIKDHGMYRNIVVAKDGTVLAGEGITEAAGKLEMDSVPVVVLNVDPNDPLALKILVADNEVSHLGSRDDRVLTELLKTIKDEVGLLGTGFDDMMLANLTMVTRPTEEIADFDAAKEWIGMPEYDAAEKALWMRIYFKTAEDQKAFLEKTGLLDAKKTKFGKNISMWWPPVEQDDVKSLRYEEDKKVEEK